MEKALNEKFTWGSMTKEEYETKEHVSGHLMWLENKTNRSEYEEAVYKKLIEKYGTTE
jgi:hypothetical protein